MATEIVMPRLSDTMDSGTVAKWLKGVGDAVKRGEIIAEIETDKANMELESYATGILARIVVPEGQSAGLGQPIAVIAANEDEAKQLSGGESGGNSDSQANPSAPAKPQAQVPQGEAPPQESQTGVSARGEAQTGASSNGSLAAKDGQRADAALPQSSPADDARTDAPERAGGRIKASPLARRLAAENRIDISALSGTGPGGRIIKDDVLSHLKGMQSSPQTAVVREETAVTAAPPQSDHAVGRAGTPVELTRMQSTIARRMTEARFSAPDFVLTAEIDMTEARAMLKTIAAVDGAPKIGPNDLLIRAVGVALGQHPDVNSGWEKNTVVRYGRVNVGFAVTIPGGLVVPVVHDANVKSLGQIALETKPLIEKARTGKLAPSDYEYGTFSISNLGMYGIDQFTPIINVPEACILGVGAITAKPVVVNGEIVVRERMRVNLACDHRVVNGSQGAEFMQTLRRLLENPMLAVL